jgi:hypothetical protein
MLQRLGRLIAALSVGLLAASQLAAQEPPAPAARAGNIAMEPEPVHRWLDEVRAQRQAREERRRAAKEAMEARRRWIDPWGAAQQEAREQELQRRRDALKEKIEREREAFRSQVPWGPQQNPWQDEATGPGPDFPAVPDADTAGPPEQPLAPPTPYALPGWDNHWYYRGY